MSLRRIAILLALVAVAVIALFSFLRSAPPTVPFAKVTRQDLVSNLNTNGSVEPEQAAEIRAETSGALKRLRAEQGSAVSAGQVILELDAGVAASRIQDAQAAVEAARIRLNQATTGGPPLPRRELEASVRESQLNLAAAERELAALQRLRTADAATPEEVQQQQARVELLSERAASLKSRLNVLSSPTEEAAARAALESARASLADARRMAAELEVRSPITGTLYQLGVRPGAWLNPGDLVGMVGQLQRVRVLVFVDEPELGRVRKGLPVTIRWDALPDRVWKGEVDRLPSRIQALGTRQVGEVACLIENPGGDLLPGTNVNVEIETARASGTLVIPKQALRRRLGQDGVWRLQGDSIQWRPVRTGISSLTYTQVLEGLAEGDSVALIYDRELSENMPVSPAYP